MTTLQLNTQIEYDFSGKEVTVEEKLAIIRRCENAIKDTVHGCTITRHCSSDGQEFFDIAFYLPKDNSGMNYQDFKFQLADRKLYFCDFSELKDLVQNQLPPNYFFYDSPTAQIFSWVANEGENVKYSLPQAVAFVNYIRKMVEANISLAWRIKSEALPEPTD